MRKCFITKAENRPAVAAVFGLAILMVLFVTLNETRKDIVELGETIVYTEDIAAKLIEGEPAVTPDEAQPVEAEAEAPEVEVVDGKRYVTTPDLKFSKEYWEHRCRVREYVDNPLKRLYVNFGIIAVIAIILFGIILTRLVDATLFNKPAVVGKENAERKE